MSDGGFCKQASGIQPRKRAVIRAHKKRNLGTPEDYAIAAMSLQPTDDLVISQPGTLRKFSAHQFAPNDAVDDFLIVGCRREYVHRAATEYFAIHRTGHGESCA